jgi:hypothetical protein
VARPQNGTGILYQPINVVGTVLLGACNPKVLGRYSGWDWIMVILLSVSVLKELPQRGQLAICASDKGHRRVKSELKVKIRPFFLILMLI